MDRQELEIARLNASLALANSQLKQMSASPRPRRGGLAAPAIVLGLCLGAALGLTLGFTSAGAEPFLGQLITQLGTEAFAALR